MAGFQRDLNIESEVRFWEHVSTCFWEVLLQQDIGKFHNGNQNELHKDLFSLIFSFSNPNNDAENKFDSKFTEKVKQIYSHTIPIYDIDEPSPFESEKSG